MKNINLTNEEKKEIVDNLDVFYKDETSLNTLTGVMVSLFGLVGPLWCLAIALLQDPLAFKGIIMGISVGVVTPIIVETCKHFIFRKNVTKKISFRQFKKLEKSGEIAKWQREFATPSATIEVTDYVASNDEKINATIIESNNAYNLNNQKNEIQR